MVSALQLEERVMVEGSCCAELDCVGGQLGLSEHSFELVIWLRALGWFCIRVAAIEHKVNFKKFQSYNPTYFCFPEIDLRSKLHGSRHCAPRPTFAGSACSSKGS